MGYAAFGEYLSDCGRDIFSCVVGEKLVDDVRCLISAHERGHEGVPGRHVEEAEKISLSGAW